MLAALLQTLSPQIQQTHTIERKSFPLPQYNPTLPNGQPASRVPTKTAAFANAERMGGYMREARGMQPPSVAYRNYFADHWPNVYATRPYRRKPAQGTERLLTDIRHVTRDWDTKEKHFKWASMSQRRASGINYEKGPLGATYTGKWYTARGPIQRHLDGMNGRTLLDEPARALPVYRGY